MIEKRLKAKDIIVFNNYEKLYICYINFLSNDFYCAISNSYDLNNLQKHFYKENDLIWYTSQLELDSKIIKSNTSIEEYNTFVKYYTTNFIFQ